MAPPHLPGRCTPTRWMKLRAVIAMGALFAALLLLVARLAQIQLTDHDRYARLALQQHTVERATAPRRGTIYDTCGRSLATSVVRSSIFADPSALEDAEAAALLLSRALDLEWRALHEKLTTPRQFVWVKRQVSDAEAERVRAMSLEGVHVRQEHHRHYPQSRVACHVVGFTDTDGRGLAGVEFELDRLLQGRPGLEALACDARRRVIRQADDQPLEPRANGYEVHLTIDSCLQAIVQEELALAAEKHEPESAWAVVLDARTGGVLAMASWPDFDPNCAGMSPPASRRNRLITDIYEFGSIMKPFAVAAALEEGRVTPETQFDCHNGAWRVGARTVHDVHPYGTLTVSDIITKSSNIGAAQIGLLLGVERFHRRLESFGLCGPTGIGLPGEAGGLLRAPQRWNEHSLISVSFGQEHATTPLSVVCAFNVFPTGGLLLHPQILKKVALPGVGQPVYEMNGPLPVRRVLSPQNAAHVMRMLRRVVEEGTGRSARLAEYAVAGKTGTAQLIREDGRGYRDGAYLSSFVGMAPAEDPRLTVLVSLKAPSKNGYYGGVVAAPACRSIILRSLRYMGVPERRRESTMARAER